MPQNKAEARNQLEERRLEVARLIAGGLAHDLNNLITIIGHTVELAEMIDDMGRYRESSRQVMQLCTRSRLMIERVLTLSATGATRRKNINLAELTGATLRIMRATLPAEVQIDGVDALESATVKADENQLQEILIHLIQAAVTKLTAAGGTVALSLKRQSSDPSEFTPDRSQSQEVAVWKIQIAADLEVPELWRQLHNKPDHAAGKEPNPMSGLTRRVQDLLKAHEGRVAAQQEHNVMSVIWPVVEIAKLDESARSQSLN